MKTLPIIMEAINKTKGENVNIYEANALNPFIDYIVICEASSYRQVYAMATNIKDLLKENGIHIKSFEGQKDSKWILLDVDDVIVHVFLTEERDNYALDELYANLPQVNLDDLQ